MSLTQKGQILDHVDQKTAYCVIAARFNSVERSVKRFVKIKDGIIRKQFAKSAHGPAMAVSIIICNTNIVLFHIAI